MASFFYVIVKRKYAKELGLAGLRQKIGRGCYLLNEKDFSTMAGNTLYERIQPYEGIPVSEAEAKQLLDGTIEPPIEKPEEIPEDEEPKISDDEEM